MEPRNAEGWSPIIDTHAHVFLREFPPADNATYHPARGHTEQDYLSVLDSHSIQFGIVRRGIDGRVVKRRTGL